MKAENKKNRPPVVVVMGHIDHGKSTLLDYIRNTNIVDKEAGGITQHISAYEVEFEALGTKRKITFLDTPGHEAFCSLRERGASVADIAVLVVSAEDGVKPQTIEAINCIKKDSMPFIVALNKIDKQGANIDKVKQNLAENNILVEGWGGTVPCVAISAKTGKNVAELLEIIALQSDLEELVGDPSVPAEGFVIESNLNAKQGISASLIIKNGTLNKGSFVYTNWAYAKVRTIENYKGESIEMATFSSPIQIVGWSAAPTVGSHFQTFHSKEAGEAFAEQNSAKNESMTEKLPPTYNTKTTIFSVVVKADTFGSLDAIEHELQKLNNDKITVRIISKGVGNITEGDVKTANTKKSLILGFNILPDKSAKILSLRDGSQIKTFNIIYELVDFVTKKVKEATPIETVEQISGIAKIIRIFSKNKDKQVVGGKVETGEIKIGSLVKILRREINIGEGKIKELQAQKIKAETVKEGQEFGIMIDSKIEIVEGDKIQATTFIKQ